jgi:hypothetical protein
MNNYLEREAEIVSRDVTIIRDRSLDRSKVRDRSIDRKGTISQSITSFFLILKSNNDFFLIYLFIITLLYCFCHLNLLKIG